MPSYQVDEYGLPVEATGSPVGGIHAGDLEARAKTEARAYSLLNPYLDDKQKAVVETWFQLPTVAFTYGFILFAFYKYNLPFKPVFGSIYVSIMVGWLTTAMTQEKLLRLALPVVACLNSLLFSLPVVIWAALSRHITPMSALAIEAISFTGLLVPGRFFADCWASGMYPRMHPKYAAAKVIFRIHRFPFEQFLPEKDLDYDQAAARGGRTICIVLTLALVIATHALG